MSTIFEELVQNENDFTQLLRNLFVRNRLLAAAALEQMSVPKLSEQDALDLVFTTQRFFKDETGRQIPDLLIEGRGFRCVVEAKIDAALSLSEQQSNGYHACFPEGTGYLCFLTPNSWKHWAQLKYVRASACPGVQVTHISWEKLVDALRRVIKDTDDAVAAEALDFLNRRFETVTLSNAEKSALHSWSGTSFSALRKLQKLTDQARGLFGIRMQTVKTEVETSTREYGFYLRDNNKYLLWIGLWDIAERPLSVGFKNRAQDWRSPSRVPHTFVKVNGWFLRPLSEASWEGPEAIYDEVSATLEELGLMD